ncbi:unnamed protein product [Pedinophyceae sp. YPF-701]|nr:unnamed protein product [Pedinophyceae sp. YPF-701]
MEATPAADGAAQQGVEGGAQAAQGPETDAGPPQEAGEPEMDLITAIQEQVNRICYLYASSLASCGEACVPLEQLGLPDGAQPSGASGLDPAKGSGEILQAHARLEELIAQLPDDATTEDAQMSDLRALLSQDQELSRQLGARTAGARGRLRAAQDAFVALAGEQVRREQTAASMPSSAPR